MTQFLGLELEEYKIASAGSEDVILVSIGCLVKKMLSVTSTEIGSDAEVTVKPIVVISCGFMKTPSSGCLWHYIDSSTYTPFADI